MLRIGGTLRHSLARNRQSERSRYRRRDRAEGRHRSSPEVTLPVGTHDGRRTLAIAGESGGVGAVFKLALLQMRVDGGDKAANLARAESLIEKAANDGAQIALLPEALNLGWTHASARVEADEIPHGATCERLLAAARQHAVFVCAGIIERAGPLRYNAAVLISPEGQVLLHHRKLNELDIAHDLYAKGDRLGVVRTSLGTFGLMICADGFAAGQVVSRTLGLMGADVILSPCAWAVPADHDNAREPYGQVWLENYGPVARDFQMWIAGCSNVGWITDGPWRGRRCIGCSLIVGPRGAPLLRGPYGVEAETILYIDVNPDSRRGPGSARD